MSVFALADSIGKTTKMNERINKTIFFINLRPILWFPTLHKFSVVENHFRAGRATVSLRKAKALQTMR
jgi:hypothetical protein